MEARWCRSLLACGLLLPTFALHSTLDPHKASHLFWAIKQLKARSWSDSELCLTVDGPFMGRLSNTVSMMNTVLDFAIRTNIHFVFPRAYTQFMEQEGFSEMFGREPECPLHPARELRTMCLEDEGETSLDRKGRCPMFRLRMGARTRVRSSACNCSQIIAVNSSYLSWGHDYKRTHNILRQRYWQGKLGLEWGPKWDGDRLNHQNPRPQVAVHIRLGDVENRCNKRLNPYNCNKRLKAELYCQTIKALFWVLPASCVDVQIHTDGTLQSPDIKLVKKCISDTGVEPTVLTQQSISTLRSFTSLVAADVLVFGSSGYGQVAAVLGRESTARVGAPMPPYFSPNPLDFLPNTTQLFADHNSSNVSLADAAAKLAQNEAIQALAARCRLQPPRGGLINLVGAPAAGLVSEERDLFES